MATISGTQGNWKIELIVTESGTNVEANTSSAKWELWIKRTDSGDYPLYGTPTIKIKVSGKKVYDDSKYFAIDSITKKGVKLLSGTATGLAHNEDGTIKSKVASFSWSGSGFSPSSVSGSGSYSASTIPRKTPAPDIVAYVEELTSVTLKPYSSKFSHTVRISLGSLTYYLTPSGTLSNTQVRIPSGTTMPLTFITPTDFYSQFTGAEANGTVLVTTYSTDTSDVVIGDNSATLTIRCGDKCKPTLISKSIIDINQTTTSVSGDPTYLINGHSTAQVSVEVSATSGLNDIGTTVTSIVINGQTAENAVANFPNITTNMFEITMTNSRGISNTEYFSNGGKFINYFNPTFVGTVSRVDPTSGRVKVTFNGKYYKGIINIPNSTNNNLVLTYAYKQKNSSEWINPANPIISDWTNTENGYEGSFVFPENFDYTSQFDFIIYYTDEIGSRQSEPYSIARGLPIFWWSSNGFHVLGDLTINDKNFIDTIYPVGSVYCHNENTNPSSIFGGTWELIDKEFEGIYLNNDDGTLFTPNNTNISEHSVAFTRNKNTIRIRLNCTLKVDVADTKVILGKLNFGEIGISRITSGFFGMVGGNDGANALFVYNVDYENGEISIMDVIGKSENEVPSGTKIYLDFTFINDISHILNEACDKFYWKRTE